MYMIVQHFYKDGREMFIKCSNKRVAYKKCKQLNIEYKDKGYYFYVQKMTKKEKELYKIGK